MAIRIPKTSGVKINLQGLLCTGFGGTTGQIELDGKKMPKVSEVSFHASADQVPQLEVTMNALPDFFAEIDNAYVGIIFEPKTLDDAAKVLAYELKSHGAWYDTIRSQLIKCMQKHELPFDDTDYDSVADDFIDNYLIGEKI